MNYLDTLHNAIYSYLAFFLTSSGKQYLQLSLYVYSIFLFLTVNWSSLMCGNQFYLLHVHQSNRQPLK